MMKNLILCSLALILAGCASHLDEPERITSGTPEMPADEVVDIRIDERGEMRINNRAVSESSLPGAIEALDTDDRTRVRLIIHEKAYTGLVNKTVRLLYGAGVTQFKSKMLDASEFEHYSRKFIHIDVLSTGKIIFRGHQIYPDDLPTAFDTPEFSKEEIIVLSVIPEAPVGSVTDVQTVLRKTGFLRIQYVTL